MPEAHLEEAIGTIDGSNVDFLATLPYTAGSVVVFLNGISTRVEFDDGWLEASPPSGLVTLKEAPRAGDVVFLFYRDTLPDGFGEPPDAELEVFDAQAFLELLDARATLEPVPSIVANIELEDNRVSFELLPQPAEVITEIFFALIDPAVELAIDGPAELTVTSEPAELAVDDASASIELDDES